MDTAIKPRILVLSIDSDSSDLEAILTDYDINIVKGPESTKRAAESSTYKLLIIRGHDNYVDNLVETIRKSNENIGIIEISNRFGSMSAIARAQKAGILKVYPLSGIKSGLLKLGIDEYFKSQ